MCDGLFCRVLECREADFLANFNNVAFMSPLSLCLLGSGADHSMNNELVDHEVNCLTHLFTGLPSWVGSGPQSV